MNLTPEDLETHVASSEVVDSHDYRNPENEDDYYGATLRKASDGRHFWYVEASGYDSSFAGASNLGGWLDESQVASWRDAIG